MQLCEPHHIEAQEYIGYIGLFGCLGAMLCGTPSDIAVSVLVP